VRIVFTSEAWQDYTTWTDQRKVLSRINRMINEACRDPGFGIGKPERLAGDLAGFWSRRIDQEHRMVYEIHGEDVVIVQVRYHY
jgi:toxin YoeB